MFRLSAASKRNRVGVDHRLIEIGDLAIKITRVDFGYPDTGGLRNATQQLFLYKSGKSGADGYKVISAHQRGKALDFFAYVDGKANYSHAALTAVASAHYESAMRLGYRIKWGGFFKSMIDMPHIELID